MSADNYLLIRKYGGQYSVTNESASADEESVASCGKMHDTLGNAYRYACNQYSEYGVRLSRACLREIE